MATVSAVAPGSGTPTGDVQFFAGTTPIGTATLVGGVATLETSAIPRGSQILTASFAGSADFLTSFPPPVRSGSPATPPVAAPAGVVPGVASGARHVVDRQGYDPSGGVVIGVTPVSAVTPVQLLAMPA